MDDLLDRPATRPDGTTSSRPQQDAAVASRRRFRTLNLILTLPMLIAVGIFLITRETQTWGQAGVYALGLTATVIAFERWTAGDIRRVAAPCLAVTALVWPYGVFVVDGPTETAFQGLSIVGSLTVAQLSRYRVVAAIALVGYVLLIGVIGLATGPEIDNAEVLSKVIVPTGVTAIVTGLMFPNQKFYDTVAVMEEERRREGELAVMRERVRFAGDLHDIQGHTLHVAKLKIALARRLVHTNPDAAEQELVEVHDLIADTIAQAKELAYGRRRLNLSAELTNARNLFEAAGIRVTVDQQDELTVGPGAEVLGQVLRETTTNILRHAQARQVRITLTGTSLSVANDGATGDGPPQLGGLATLAQRVSELGGELTVQQDGARFVTTASLSTPSLQSTPSAVGPPDSTDDEANDDDHGGAGR